MTSGTLVTGGGLLTFTFCINSWTYSLLSISSSKACNSSAWVDDLGCCCWWLHQVYVRDSAYIHSSWTPNCLLALHGLVLTHSRVSGSQTVSGAHPSKRLTSQKRRTFWKRLTSCKRRSSSSVSHFCQRLLHQISLIRLSKMPSQSSSSWRRTSVSGRRRMVTTLMKIETVEIKGQDQN